MNARILLVEDERAMREVLTDLLRAQGHELDTAAEGTTGMAKATEGGYDLLILDIMLPGASGLQICHAARQHGFDGAILFLTARGQTKDCVEGLRTGADDYLVKPFNPAELIARVDALLRRVRKSALTPVMTITFGNVTADFTTMTFTKAGDPLALAGKESELLRLLVNHRGQVLSREKILRTVWKEQPAVTGRTVDVHIMWLRQKLEADSSTPRHILTVRGEGYRFEK